MAYYGIPSASKAITASTANDTVSMANLGGTLVTAASVYGGDGNDIISFAAVGITASARNVVSGVSGLTSGLYTTHLYGSATYSGSKAISGTLVTATVTARGVLTSQQAARSIINSYVQGNTGNDSIALGDAVSTVSASTLAGGAGDDIIGSFKNVNNVWTGTKLSSTFKGARIEGGAGNDTIHFSGDGNFTSTYLNANKGNDVVKFLGYQDTLNASEIGLGQGDDVFSGDIATLTSTTIAGGKGNDTIVFSGATIENSIIGGARANNDVLDGDGADLIKTEYVTNFTASTIYGGGGNDTVTFSGHGMTGSLVSLNKGADVFSANDTGLTISDSVIGLGADGDTFAIVDGAKITTSRINAGKGADSIYFGSAAIESTDFASTTIYGGAGADWLVGSATLSDAGTMAVTLEYLATTESTAAAMDTIAVGAVDAGSGAFSFRYEPGGSLATFAGDAFSGTNGVVVFSSTYASNDVTARIADIAANTTEGQAAAFQDNAGVAYLFVKGSSDDMVVQVGTAAVSSVASLSLNASKNFTLTING